MIGSGSSKYPATAAVSIAPMLDWTDRHYRYFMRRITRHALLYTEMITSAAIVHGDAEYLLAFHPDEHPIALQLGGDDPEQLRRAVEIAQRYGYDEYNLNVGCPSVRVQKGNFGAILMDSPEVVAAAIRAMREVTDKPVTVKHRIGIDDRGSYEHLRSFVAAVVSAGAQRCTVHARIAVLTGLKPKENRQVPPLRYADVYRLKSEFPDVPIEINGAVRTIPEIAEHLRHVDAVMIGRAAYANPYLFSTIDSRFFGDSHPIPSRTEVVESMYDYVDGLREKGVAPRRIFAHMLGLFAGIPGARYWKRTLSGKLPDLGAELLRQALDQVLSAGYRAGSGDFEAPDGGSV